MGLIKVENLGKAYKQYPHRWGRLLEWIWPFGKKLHRLKWVLRGISFQVTPGRALGIIGVNGAGKSTLLKIISGTTQATEGHVLMTGRVAALLELGMGFHPEFTGRQNAYLAAQLLGFSASEIEALMPEIESFADIGDYMDQPVRVYSSGMQMRVAFSVATARRPDILIVDEALSVGDSHFQHKSFQRIKEFRDQGTTLLLVSHDKAAIQATCDEAILINHGELVMQGKPEVVMNYYNALLSDSTVPVLQRELADGQTQTFSGNGFAKFQKISLLNELEQSIEVLQVGQQARLHFAVQVFQDLPELVLGYVIKDRLGQPVFGTNTHYLNQVLKDLPAGKEIIFDFNFSANIGPGYYSVSVALHSADNHVGDNYEWRDLALFFDVVLVNQSSFVGVSWLPPSLKIT